MCEQTTIAHTGLAHTVITWQFRQLLQFAGGAVSQGTILDTGFALFFFFLL